MQCICQIDARLQKMNSFTGCCAYAYNRYINMRVYARPICVFFTAKMAKYIKSYAHFSIFGYFDTQKKMNSVLMVYCFKPDAQYIKLFVCSYRIGTPIFIHTFRVPVFALLPTSIFYLPISRRVFRLTRPPNSLILQGKAKLSMGHQRPKYGTACLKYVTWSLSM